MLALCASRPVAKAFGSSSGTTHTRGFGSPDAIAISSTTLTSCFCAGVAGSMISHAPVDQSTRSGPYRQAIPADARGDDGGEQTDEGDDVVIGARRRVGGEQAEAHVAAEADPREEDDESDDQPVRAAAVGLLLREEVGVLAHCGGLFSDRSTLGTARSAASSISHSSAGVALASPATSSVGKVACLVLYCVATSL